MRWLALSATHRPTSVVLPQFDLENQETGSGMIRARSAEEAVRRWLDASDEVDVAFEEPDAPMEALEGWRAVYVDGIHRGRIRPHQRMRFRRD